MRVLRAGLVGYGMFGADVVSGTLWDLHRNGLAPYLDRIGLDDWCSAYADSRVHTVAVGTRSEASAHRARADFAEHTGQAPQVFWGDRPWASILASGDLDVLVIATPDHLHYEPAIAALNAGVHVVVEKPLCLSAAQAYEIVETAERNDLITGVDMHKRYDPDHIRIFRELARSMGVPLYARGVLEEPLEVSACTFKWAAESDPFTYVGVHWVDLFCHYLGLRPSALYATGQKRLLRDEYGIDTFDSTQVTVMHECGTAVTYDNSWVTPPDFEGPVNQECQLLMTRGKVESDSQYRGLRYWVESGGSRTANTHFFRRVQRPDGTWCHLGYGKDSLVDCLEKVARVKLLGASASSLAGTYPDARSQLTPCLIIDAARAAMRRNHDRQQKGLSPTVTAAFERGSYRLVGDEG